MKYILLASSNTVQGITEMINSYFCSSNYTVNPDTLTIEHPVTMRMLSVRVVKVKGRYRFERVA